MLLAGHAEDGDDARPLAGSFVDDGDDAGLYVGCPDSVFMAWAMVQRCSPAAPPKMEMTPGYTPAVATSSSQSWR